jgi:hypothetical protein
MTTTKPTTETKHTPGPWTAQQDCRSYRNTGIFDGNNPDAQGNQNAWAIYGHTRIAILTEAETWLPQQQVDANARLIAAAPELLEELRNCVRHNADILDNCLFPAHGLKANLTPEQSLWREKIKKWNTEARAAIAKATGQN